MGEVGGRIEISPPMRRIEDDVWSEDFGPARCLELCLYTCIYRPTINSNGSICFDILQDLHFIIPNHRWSTALSSLLRGHRKSHRSLNQHDQDYIGVAYTANYYIYIYIYMYMRMWEWWTMAEQRGSGAHELKMPRTKKERMLRRTSGAFQKWHQRCF